MKRNIILGTVLALAMVGQAWAADRYWSGNGSTPGGAGTWDITSSTNWGTAATGPFDAQWINGNNDFAIFGGTAGNVLLGTGITVGGLTFNTTGYVVTNAANTLTFGATDNAITLNNIASARIAGTVAGSGNVTLTTPNPATAGTVTFANVTTGGWTGTTTVQPGITLYCGISNQALKNTSSITINGGAIVLENSTGVSTDRMRDAAAIAVGAGGSFYITSLAGSALTETIGAANVVAGQFNLGFVGTSSGGATVTLAALTNSGSTAAFTATRGGTSVNKFVVTGASATPAGQIIGPWATIAANNGGGNYAIPAATDYAIYNASSELAFANIAASAENSGSWIAGANVTLSNATTLTAARTVDSLRYSGAAATLALGGNNLETYGLLNGGSGTLTLTNGVLTTPLGGGAGTTNNLFITTGNNAITVAGGATAITDNGAVVTLVKSGGNTLTLTSTNSTYSGGTVLNAGALTTTTPNSNLGTGPVTVNGSASWAFGTSGYSRALTINDGAVLSLSGTSGLNFSGVLSGNGALNQTGSIGIHFNNTGNTFTGPITIGYQLTFASLGDSANPINFCGTSGWIWSGGAKTFALRPFTLNAAGNAPLNNNGTGALTIQQPLAISGATGARTLTLGGTYTAAANTFAGYITDSPVSVVSVTKGSGSIIWALSGTNTYSGTTTITTAGDAPNTGALVFQGIQALSPSTALTLSQPNSNNRPSTFKILDDSATPESRSGVNLNYSCDQNSAADGRERMSIFVGNNSTANGGTSSSTQTGSTIQLGNFNITQTSSGQTTGAGLAVFGANGYKLQITNVNVTLQAAYSGNWNMKLNATNNALIVAGNVQQVAGATNASTTIQLDGTNTASLISGIIKDSADLSARPLSISKIGSGTWTLSGDNTFTGPTTVSVGTLVLAGSQCLPDTTNLTITGTARVQLNDGVKEKVGSLILGATTYSAATTWGSTNSSALNKTNFFLGTGLLYVNMDPPVAGTVIMLQ
jgi:autotransporter-associated beta strand protein